MLLLEQACVYAEQVSDEDTKYILGRELDATQ